MHLTIVVGQLGIGGGEKQLYWVLKGMDRERFSPAVITLNPGRDEYWEHPIRDLGVPVLSVHRSANKLARLSGLARLLRDTRAEIVHSWGIKVNLAVALAGRLSRTPVRMGSVRSNLHRRGRTGWQRRSGIWGLDHFIVNSTRGGRDLAALGIDPERISVVFNALAERDPSLENDERIALRRSWRAEERLVIANIGQLSPVKNHALLLRLTRSLVDDGLPVRTVVFGDGALRAELHQLSEQLGLTEHVLFLGQDARAATLIQAADLFCFTSSSEGMPNVLLEAGAAGLPVVTTDVGGARDVVCDGKTGFIVPVNDLEQLTRRTALLLRDADLRHTMGQAAQRHVTDRFSEKQLVAGIQAAYEIALQARLPMSVRRSTDIDARRVRAGNKDEAG